MMGLNFRPRNQTARTIFFNALSSGYLRGTELLGGTPSGERTCVTELGDPIYLVEDD